MQTNVFAFCNSTLMKLEHFHDHGVLFCTKLISGAPHLLPNDNRILQDIKICNCNRDILGTKLIPDEFSYIPIITFKKYFQLERYLKPERLNVYCAFSNVIGSSKSICKNQLLNLMFTCRIRI